MNQTPIIVPHSVQRPSFGVLDILGIVFFFGILCVNGLTYTLVLLPIVVAYYFTSSGIQYDPKYKSIRCYKALFSIRVGTWYEIKDVEKVLLKRSKYKVNRSGPYFAISSSTTDVNYSILLHCPKSSSNINIGVYQDEKQGIECIKAIETLTHLPVFVPFK